MKQPLVTAVIPAYNAERFLADAIASVLDQTYPHIECVVVDDGSTDGTIAVAERFMSQIRLVSTPNEGVSAARNKGAAAGSGPLLAFLDADDLWLPKKIERQVDEMQRRDDLAMTYTGVFLVDEDLDFRGRIGPPPPVAALRNTLLMEPPILMTVTYLIRRTVFEAEGGFDGSLSTSADCDFSCRVALRHPIGVIDAPLHLYRLHPGQMHRDLDTTERDMKRVFSKLYSENTLPSDLRRTHNRAYANLYVSLAGAHLQRGNLGRFGSYAFRAFIRRPDRVVNAVKRLTSPYGAVSRAQ